MRVEPDGEQAGRRFAEPGGRRVVAGQAVGVEDLVLGLFLQPGDQPVDLGGRRHLAEAVAAAADRDDAAGRADQSQQVRLEQRDDLADVAGLAQAAAQRHQRLAHLVHVGAALLGLQVGQPQRHRLADEFGQFPQVEGDAPGLRVVAGDQAPQPAALHQRDGDRRLDPHVAQVFDMDRRHAAQHGQRHVERPVAVGQAIRDQRHRFGIDVGQHADQVAGVQLARLRRDVGGREMVAEQAGQRVVAAFRNDLAVPQAVEAVQHDPVEAGQRLDAFGDELRVAQEIRFLLGFPQRVAGGDEEVAEILQFGFVAGLHLDDPVAVDAMDLDGQRQRAAAAAQVDLVGDRRLQVAAHRQLPDALGVFRIDQVGQRLADGAARRDPEVVGEVGAGLDHAPGPAVDDDQRAARLDLAGRVDGFHLAALQRLHQHIAVVVHAASPGQASSRRR